MAIQLMCPSQCGHLLCKEAACLFGAGWDRLAEVDHNRGPPDKLLLQPEPNDVMFFIKLTDLSIDLVKSGFTLYQISG